MRARKRQFLHTIWLSLISIGFHQCKPSSSSSNAGGGSPPVVNSDAAEQIKKACEASGMIFADGKCALGVDSLEASCTAQGHVFENGACKISIPELDSEKACTDQGAVWNQDSQSCFASVETKPREEICSSQGLKYNSSTGKCFSEVAMADEAEQCLFDQVDPQTQKERPAGVPILVNGEIKCNRSDIFRSSESKWSLTDIEGLTDRVAKDIIKFDSDGNGYQLFVKQHSVKTHETNPVNNCTLRSVPYFRKLTPGGAWVDYKFNPAGSSPAPIAENIKNVIGEVCGAEQNFRITDYALDISDDKIILALVASGVPKVGDDDTEFGSPLASRLVFYKFDGSTWSSNFDSDDDDGDISSSIEIKNLDVSLDSNSSSFDGLLVYTRSYTRNGNDQIDARYLRLNDLDISSAGNMSIDERDKILDFYIQFNSAAKGNIIAVKKDSKTYVASYLDFENMIPGGSPNLIDNQIYNYHLQPNPFDQSSDFVYMKAESKDDDFTDENPFAKVTAHVFNLRSPTSVVTLRDQLQAQRLIGYHSNLYSHIYTIAEMNSSSNKIELKIYYQKNDVWELSRALEINGVTKLKDVNAASGFDASGQGFVVWEIGDGNSLRRIFQVSTDKWDDNSLSLNLGTTAGKQFRILHNGRAAFHIEAYNPTDSSAPYQGQTRYSEVSSD